MSVLDQILESVRAEVERRIREKPFEAYEPPRKKLSLVQAIRQAKDVPLIAEVKRASPSGGDIRPNADPVETAREMVDGGAIAISVLTERSYFRGDPKFLFELASSLEVPLLCKDFIIHPYQLREAANLGADAVLLIAKVLGPKLQEFVKLAYSLGLDPLLEITNEEELRLALSTEAELMGINNRNLETLEVDLRVTERLAPLVPAGRVVISESGITTPEDVRRVLRAGAHAVLVGTSIMRAENIREKVRELVGASP